MDGPSRREYGILLVFGEVPCYDGCVFSHDPDQLCLRHPDQKDRKQGRADSRDHSVSRAARVIEGAGDHGDIDPSCRERGDRASCRSFLLYPADDRLSCGCLQKEKVSKKLTIDMMNFENEHFKVIERDTSSKNGTARWKCICKHCGNVFTIEGKHLRA